MDNHISESVFLDIAINDQAPHRVVIGLWGDNYPRATENFLWLCREKFENTLIFKIYHGVAVEGGDFVNNNGSGGFSKFGCRFDDEKPLLKPVPSFVGYVNSGQRNDNGSEFVIFTGDADYLTGKYQIFGRVTEGMNFIKEIERSGVDKAGNVISKIVIESCGVCE